MGKWKSIVAGAKRSWTIWLNVLTAGLAALELANGNLLTVFGPQKTAAIMIIVGVLNVVLRAVKTNESLESKGAAAIARKADSDLQS